MRYKASLLVPGREFIVSRRKKLVPKMELSNLSNLLPASSCAKKIDRDPKASESPRKIDSIHQNDSIAQ